MKACQKYQSIRNMEAIMPWRPKTTFTSSFIFRSNDPVKKRDCSDGIIQDELNRSFFLTEMIYLILYKCDEDAFNYFYSRFIFL